MTVKIEEILGYNAASEKKSENITKAYYIKADTSEEARTKFDAFAKGLPVPACVRDPDSEMELGDVQFDEEKNANGLYFGTISFKTPENDGKKRKSKIADDLEELFGEKKTVGRKSGTHERHFRIKAQNVSAAGNRLESYIRSTMETSGRLHISDISVADDSEDEGWWHGTVSYSNPDHKGPRDKLDGQVHVPAYGNRWSETYKNGTHIASAAENVFELRGYSDAFAALNALKSAYQNNYVKEISIEEDSSGADRVYVGRIQRTEEVEEPDDDDNKRSISFEVSGSQTKRTHSIGTVGGWAAGGMTPRNYGGLIGVTDDGVEGVDIDTAVSTFSETVYFYPWFLTSSYVAFLARAYGCVNNSPFRGFAVGEVRFLGASGSYRAGDKFAEMTFKFAVSPNAWNIRVGSMTIPFKYGWDYLWVRWADMKMGNVTVKVPIEAYVERVYQGLNFYSLGIG